jgi:hypothetical protein
VELRTHTTASERNLSSETARPNDGSCNDDESKAEPPTSSAMEVCVVENDEADNQSSNNSTSTLERSV